MMQHFVRSGRLFFPVILLLILLPGLQAQDFGMGLDLSYVNELEDCGALYYDRDGQQADPYALLSAEGANMVRLRLWHNPDWTAYSTLEDIKKAMARAKAQEMQVMLDFHYSDFWADPSRQWRPAAWNNVDDDGVLGDSLYNYTYATLKKLIEQDLVPAIAQLGNEINGNILIKRSSQDIDDSSPGMYPVNWSRQVGLLNRANDAVRQVNTDYGTSIRTLVHVAQPENATSWFASATSSGLTEYDIIGLSYYPQWSDFGIHELGKHVAFLASEYDKEVMIVEIGYPWTLESNDWAGNVIGRDSRMEVYNNEISPEVQLDFLTEVTYLVKDYGGTGLVYWEPAWISSDCSTYWGQGSHYENAALFDFDSRLNTGAGYLGYNYELLPPGLQERDVSFKVNMKGEDTSNGVYVTGDFTGEQWQFIAMDPAGDSWFEFDTIIPGRSLGAYIFYNSAQWNNNYRETVPGACAEMWDTHRKYLVNSGDELYEFAWGSCTAFPVGMDESRAGQLIAYDRAARQIILDGKRSEARILISDLSGRIHPPRFSGSGVIDVSGLVPGLYILILDDPAERRFFKFIR